MTASNVAREFPTAPCLVVLAFGLVGAGCGTSVETNDTASSSRGNSSTASSGGAGGESGAGGTGGVGGGGGEGGAPDAACGDGVVGGGEECDNGAANANDAACTVSCKLAACGDGLVYANIEECDDGNGINSDACTVSCKAPACNDGILSGNESDIDCGGSCNQSCMLGQVCSTGSDCVTANCNAGTCGYAASCAALLQGAPGLPDGIYAIDPDGMGSLGPYDVYCDMMTDNGGWTLVLVGSDDETATWTWQKRALLSTDKTLVGNINQLNKDFKSAAHHDIPFSDLLFVHNPSGIWAAYANVGNATLGFADFMANIPYPVCDAALAGNGYPMTAGTLTVAQKLCDSDLYFHQGDFDGFGAGYCMDLNSPYNSATYGPAWNTDFGNGCPFDEPGQTGLGPSNLCGSPQCAGHDLIEESGVGFGSALNLNTGVKGAAQNYFRVFVR